MSIVTTDQATAHLRLAPGDDDGNLALYIGAAERAAQNYCNRAIYADDAALQAAIAAGDDDGTGIAADEAITAGILLILGHLYTNREDVITGLRAAAVAVPESSAWLLAPYRIQQGVC